MHITAARRRLSTRPRTAPIASARCSWSPVSSTAVDLMRAAELVARGADALLTEEMLLKSAPVEETPWVLTLAEPEEALA
jgi:hypothetical protein